MNKYSFKNNACQAGYNLVGISFFMVVLGILVSGGIGLKQKYDWAKRQEVTIANTAIIKDALKRYQSLHGVLPCPASLTEPLSSASFGNVTNCSAATVAGTFQDTGRGGRNIRYGAVPTRALNLPDTAMVDGWDHRYVYAVTEYYTVGSPDMSYDNGAIAIIDGQSQSMTRQDGNIIYTVMSPGGDERGAYSIDGVEIDACTSGTNCLQGNTDGKQQIAIFRQYNTRTDAGNKDFTATMTYEASSEAYEWRPGDWSACGCNNPSVRTIGRCTINFGGRNVTVTTTDGTRPSCLAGTSHSGSQSCCDNPRQTRTATCYITGTNTIVNDNKCAMSLRPALRQACAQFCWEGPDYPGCPGGCGQSPSIVRAPASSLRCLENNSKNMVFSVCDASIRPVLSKWCPGTSPCPPPPEETGGGWVDTNGDGFGDTHIRDMPNGYNGPSSSTPGGRTDGTSTKDSTGNYDGDHENGDTGWNPEP